MTTASDSASAIYQLYNLIINYVERLSNQRIDTSRYGISFSGFLLTADLTNANQAITNQDVFTYGNKTPAWDVSYIPNGDLITSYSLFLSQLVPVDLQPPDQSDYVQIMNKRIQLESQLNDQLRDSDSSIATRSSAKSLTTTMQALLDELNSNEGAARSLIARITGTQTARKSMQPSSSVPSLSEALGAVSFITGARKITGLNSYNMPVSNNPPGPNVSYAPSFSVSGLTNVFSQWLKNASTDVFPVSIDTSVDSAPISSWGFGMPDEGNSSDSTWQPFRVESDGSKSFAPPLQQIQVSNYFVKAKFSGLGLFPIDAGVWYEPDFFSQNAYDLRADSSTFFGQNGSLALTPSSLILAYNFRMKMMLSELDFTNLKSDLEKSLSAGIQGLRIGPIDLVFSGAGQNAKYNFLTESRIFEILPSNNKVLHVLAVVSQKNNQIATVKPLP